MKIFSKAVICVILAALLVSGAVVWAVSDEAKKISHPPAQKKPAVVTPDF